MGGSTHQEEQHQLGAPNAGGTEIAWEGMVPAAVLAHFRRSGRGAVDGEWRCSLCLVDQSRPNQKFAHHCNTAGHKEKLRTAKDILGSDPRTSELRDLLEEIPRRISGA